MVVITIALVWISLGALIESFNREDDAAGVFVSLTSLATYLFMSWMIHNITLDYRRELLDMDMRDKIVRENIASLKSHLDKLTEWEAEFVLDMCERYHEDFSRISSRQFNKLASIAQDVKKRIGTFGHG